MSIKKVKRRKGNAYIVWWKDENRRTRNKTFDLKRDADAFDAKIKLAKRSGDLDQLDAGKERLDEFVAEWWEVYAQRRLDKATLRHYSRLRDQYLLPALGHVPIRKLKPRMIQGFVADLEDRGTGAPTIRKTLAMLQGIMERAVEWERVDANPVRVVKKPSAPRKRTVRAVPPLLVERLRDQAASALDSTLIAVLAYGGLRPGEALALTWGDIGEQTIRVDKAVALGNEKDTKTRKHRSVRLLRPLAQDLAEWRLRSGRPDDSALVFPMQDGRRWTDAKYRNWRRRVYQPLAREIGVASPRPYDLRHSLASLLFAEGMNPAEIAEQMGHSLQTLLSVYVHVIDELRETERRSAEDLIREAREELATPSVPDDDAEAREV